MSIVFRTNQVFGNTLTVPTGTGKPEKPGKWESIHLGKDWKTRKVGEFYPKYWKIEKYWESWGNLSASNSENPANMVP